MLDSPQMHVAWLTLKWSLVAFGAFLWVMLWWSRAPLLGILQGCLIGYVLLRERWPHLGRHGRDRPLDR